MDINKAYQLIKQKLTTCLSETKKLLPNILLAAVVLVIGFYIAKIVKKVAIKLIAKVSSNTTLNSLFGSVIQRFCRVVTLLMQNTSSTYLFKKQKHTKTIAISRIIIKNSFLLFISEAEIFPFTLPT